MKISSIERIVREETNNLRVKLGAKPLSKKAFHKKFAPLTKITGIPKEDHILYWAEVVADDFSKELQRILKDKDK